MTPTGSPVTVDIALPLPADIVATLGNLIDAAYPGTMIDTTAPAGTLRLTLPRARAKRVTRKTVQQAAVAPSDEPLDVLAWGHDDTAATVTLTAPQSLAITLLPLIQAALDNPDGPNYVEHSITDPNSPSDRYVVIACRSATQTPHALRQRAESERDAALALVDDLLDAHTAADPDSANDREQHTRTLDGFRAARGRITADCHQTTSPRSRTPWHAKEDR
jgi:hypothetical protein